MTACPYCFTDLAATSAAFRCIGSCSPEPDSWATAYSGKERLLPPVTIMAPDPVSGRLPTSVTCMMCGRATSQEACPACHNDLPSGWRGTRTVTVTILGARGSGKSVYIAVAMEILRRYAQQRGSIVSPLGKTQDLYEKYYYKRLFEENKVLAGTTPGWDDVLTWKVTGGAGGPFFLVIRDVAGEDVEHLSAERQAKFSFMDRADLVIFLFDPLMLAGVRKVLAGVIPDVDSSRLGDTPAKALPKVLGQIGAGRARLALTISKFDSLHALPQVDNPLAPVLANPSAHFNWDRTMVRAKLAPQQADAELESDTRFLDAELRGLLEEIDHGTVTLLADRAHQEGKFAEVRHFAVSSVGETPSHADKLTERGISPFRVVDPILWGISRAGLSV